MKTQPVAHTPTPWIENGRTQSGIRIDSVGGDETKEGMDFLLHPVAIVLRSEDAAFIVKACNAYEKDQEIIKELLAEVKALHRDKWWEYSQEEHEALCNSKIHEAISKAEGK